MCNQDLISSTTVSRRVGMVTFIGGLGGGLVFPILPTLGVKLGIAGAMIGLILSITRIARLVCAPLAGKLVDRLGGKTPLGVGLLVECLGVLCYQAALLGEHPVWWFLVGRTIFGIGSALLLVSAQSVVLRLSNIADRGRSTARIRLAISVGFPSGLVFGGLISENFSDGAAFLTGAVLTALGALAVRWLIPRKLPKPAIIARSRTFQSEVYQKGGRQLELPFLVAAWSFNLLVFFSVQGALLATMVLLVEQRHFQLMGLEAKGTAGLVMGIMMGCSALQAYAVGRILDRFVYRTTVLFPSLVGLATGFMLLGFSNTLPLALIGAILAGLSFNGINIPVLALLGDITQPEHYGRTVSRYQLFGDIGGSLGPIVGLEVGLKLGLLNTYFGLATLIALSLPMAFFLLRYEKTWRRSLS